MSCDLSVTQHSCDVLTSSLSPPFPFSSRACSRAFLALVPVYSQDQSSHDAAKGRGEREGRKGEGREQGRRGVKKGEKHNEETGTLLKNKKEGITCSSVACLVSVSFSSLSIFFVSLLICCSCSCSNVCSNCTFS